MHNALIRPGGIWTGSATVTASEMSQLDISQYKSVSGDDGGTWAPTSVITIGGSGLTVSGPFIANNCNGLTLNSAQVIDILSGGTVQLESGGLLNALAGSNIFVQSGGTLEMKPGSSLKLDTDQVVKMPAGYTASGSGLRIVATTDSGGVQTYNSTTAPTSPDAFMGASLTGAPLVVTKPLSNTNSFFDLEIPQVIRGATLTTLQVESQGTNANTPTTWPTYLPYRADFTGTRTPMRSAGAITDTHGTGGPSWGALGNTSMTVDQNNVIDPSQYTYGVRVTCPAHASGTGLWIYSLIATYSVAVLHP